jgi:PAS domain-containing protein
MTQLPTDSFTLEYRYVIGVDLGTTNSALAYVDLSEEARSIRLFAVPQLVAAAEVEARSMLPSFLYLPGEYDLAAGATALPWATDRRMAVGEFAREQGARVPGRLVSSAKSWLAHGGVDRVAPILPWGVREELPQVSPVEASRRYLQHLREAWNHEIAQNRDGFRFEEQLIILTVPAPFDEVARELTVRAAHEAGIPRVVLLEEPLAAFYAWLADHEEDWQRGMQDGQLILVCDVGGGTSDFSILGVRRGESGLRFDRLAVGEHLLLGGDNMDLTLARHMETKLMGAPGKLDAARWPQLVYQCRRAKETLLNGVADSVEITIVGASGRSLIGGALRGSLSAEEVAALILDGFFPRVASAATPEGGRRRGLTELGLPYVQDPAITRHLAAFWQRFQSFLAGETNRDAPYPDFILFNGGTLIPASIRDRIGDVVGDWFAPLVGEGWQPTELHTGQLELAVATGAAYYGRVRLGEGVRVGSGTPRAYYVAVDLPHAAAEGESAICLVPRGVEEGFETQLDAPTFEALTNQPVSFRLFTSSTRLGDGLGDLVHLAPEEITELPPIRTVLRFGKGSVGRIPVRLGVHLTEIGTLELWCYAQESDHRWQLAFDVRQSAEGADGQQGEILDQGLIDAATAKIKETFEGAASPARLREDLESTVGMAKEGWPTSLIRQLADALIEVMDQRGRTALHEARWLNLLGYSLRPGYGDPLDEWRIKQIWRLHFSGLEHPRDGGVRHEWWVLWRRIAGGLSAGQQTQLYHQLRVYLQPASQRKTPKQGFPKHISSSETSEIWMALASCERLDAKVKTSLGNELLSSIEGKPTAKELWALSRFGARIPVYGPLDRVVAPDVAARWVEKLLARKLDANNSTATALILMARRTGDRARDLPAETRDQVGRWLSALREAEHFRLILDDPNAALSEEEQSWVFGESLPAGLILYQTEMNEE